MHPAKKIADLWIKCSRLMWGIFNPLVNLSATQRQVLDLYTPMDQPFVLITQTQRSGGTLLCQLFDGHPVLAVHPHQTSVGFPDKNDWGFIGKKEGRGQKFLKMAEYATFKAMRNGYSKTIHGRSKNKFLFSLNIQKKIFNMALKRDDSRSVFNAYFTSYFNAWLNCRFHLSQAKYIVGFQTNVINSKDGIGPFWEAYPDGFIISIVRSPLSWCGSVKKFNKTLGGEDLASQMDLWRDSVERIVAEKKRSPDRVFIINFDDLVSDSENVMRLLCGKIGIAFDPVLTRPTFNLESVDSNSSFEAAKGEVDKRVLSRKSELSNEDQIFITSNYQDVFDRCVAEYAEKL